MKRPGTVPATPGALPAARRAVLAAMLGGDGADAFVQARQVLAAVSAGELVDVASTLAVMLGQPGTTLLTPDEWAVVAKALRVDP